MAINPLQFAPFNPQVPQVDFAPLGQLGEIYRQAQARGALADLGQQIQQTGNIDYNKAAGNLFQYNPEMALSLLKLGNQAKASADFGGVWGDITGQTGTTSPAPPAQTQQASPYTSMPAPPAAGPDVAPTSVNPLGRANGPVPTTARVVGDQEGVASGLYDAPNVRRPVQTVQLSPSPTGDTAPSVPVQARPMTNVPGLGGQDMSPAIPRLLRAVSNESLPDGSRKAAELLLKQAFDSKKLNSDQENYVLYRQQGGTDNFNDWLTGIKRAGAQTEQDAFAKGMAGAHVERYKGFLTAGDEALRNSADLGNLRELHQRIALDPNSQGKASAFKEAIGPYASALGIPIGSLSDIQAYSSIIQKLTPQQRPPGSGATSNFEEQMYFKSLPNLNQTPQARQVALDTLGALQNYDVQRADIVRRIGTGSKLEPGEISKADAEKQLRALPDPWATIREYRKANPQEFGQAINAARKGGSAAASPGPIPPAQQMQTTGPATAVNPQTGQKLIHDPKTNQWVPAQGL